MSETTVKQNDCEDSISGSLIEIWQANDEGCYGIVEDCDTGNPENDYFNLRGKFFSDENGNFTFESILPGYYGTRPRHIHIKVSTPDEEILVSQLYFGNDPYCENDEWCQDAEDRIILLEENESGLYGEIDLIINSTDNGIILGVVNFDSLIYVQDIYEFSHLPIFIGKNVEKKVNEILSLLNETGFKKFIWSVTLINERRWNLNLKNGITILLTEKQFSLSLKKINNLNKKHNFLASNLVEIDLRDKNNIIFQPLIKPLNIVH